MAEEKEIKKTTTRKPRTPKTEVQESSEPSIQDQMNAMMQMMAQQQQMFAMMMQQMQQPKGIVEKGEDVKEEPKQQKVRPAKREKPGKVTKQQLRRKYKDVEIYLINVTTGTVGYQGKHVSKFKDILKEKFHREYQVKFQILDKIVNLNNKSR